MKIKGLPRAFPRRTGAATFGLGLVALCAGATAQQNEETEERIRIAAASMEDAIVVDCQLPGKLRRLGGTRNYLTPGRLIRTSAIECRTRGGEYTLGDLASGTLSLQRWIVPAEQGDAEAQYYVARIHANGMDNVDVNYQEAARWYQMAADQGYTEAKQELGYLYERGLGVPKDELKALNLQREASGLGESLDYAYKIADAQAIAEDLSARLLAVNGQLRDAQLELRATQDALATARASVNEHEVAMAGLVAELEAAKRAPAVDTQKLAELEANVDALSAELRDSQASVAALERQRDAANAALSTQMVSGQAAQLELRELLSRTELAESKVESMSAELAQAQQRLIQSDDELRRLQANYREQSDALAKERALLLEAQASAGSEAGAIIAASEAKLASREARIDSLERQVAGLEAQLATAGDADAERALRRDLQLLQARFETETANLRRERDELRATQALSAEERDALFAKTRSELASRDDALAAQRRQIETLTAESSQLRSRVTELESAQQTAAQQGKLSSAKMQAQLSMARQQVSTLRNQLDEAKAEKSAVEARLLADKMKLEERIAAIESDSGTELELLRAQIDKANSEIRLQELTIRDLEQKVSTSMAEVAALRSTAKEEPFEIVSTEVRNAMEILELARSDQEPNLGNYHALLIANEDYENYDDLSTPVRDVSEIEGLLKGQYGFQVTKLVNATAKDILLALHDLGNSLSEEDNLLIYYSGRGSTPDGKPDKAYWLGVDADPRLRNTWVLAEHVSEKIRDIDARRVLLVTDSCFSRRRIQGKTMAVGRGLDAKRFKLMAGFKSRYVLTSGANIPFEDEKGDRTHSMFAKLFMEILRQNSNVLSGEMLSFELTNRIRERASNPDRATPAYNSLQNVGHVAGDFFFVPNAEPILAASANIAEEPV